MRYITLLLLILLLPAAVAENDWQPLLTTESFADWTVEGASKAHFEFDARRDVVIGHPVGNNPKNSFLCSPRTYRDFELSFDFRIRRPKLNSGVQFRSEAHAEGVRGPQFELDIASKDDFGWLRNTLRAIFGFFSGNKSFDYSSAGIYGEGMGTGWIYPGVAGGDPVAFETQGTELTAPRDWNEARLRAEGPRIQTWLAGKPRADFEYPDVDKAGVICLQVHGGDYKDPENYTVAWRNLMIREL